MVNEKMKILKMLEEGKITADEASRLLESVSFGGTSAGATATQTRPEPTVNRDNPQTQSHINTSQSYEKRDYNTDQNRTQSNSQNNYQTNNQNGGSTSSFSFDDFADDLGRKFEAFARDFEPKFQKFTEKVAEKTAMVADKISKSMQPTEPSPTRQEGRSQAGGSAFSARNKQEKTIELKVSPGNNELIISCLNAPVMLKGYNGDKISATVMCVPKHDRARIDFSVLGSKYFLDYDDDDFEKVAVDAFIPETLFNSINVSNYNGSINISTLSSGFITAYGSNGNVDINNIHAKNIKVECENGKEMRLDGIYCENAHIENYNGNLTANRMDVSNLKMTCFNGYFNMNVSQFDRYNDYSWILETSNQKLNVNLPTLPDVGYYIKAKTSLGNVKLGLTGMNYIANNPGMVEAKSIEFDTAQRKVRISMETSNASLVVN